MADTALAAVFHEAGQPMTFELFALPQLQGGEVLVRVTCSTLCGSDVRTYQGHRTTPVPTVLGHEIIGTVEAIGPGQPVLDHNGNLVKIGDRITWSIAASCGSCFYCDHDVPQKCDHLFKYGHEKIVADHPLSGGLAEFCHLAAGTAILRLPDALSDGLAAPANCATATVAAAFRTGGQVEGQAILIQGAGMLGLTACAMAAQHGARHVIVCDVDAGRLARAERFGATRGLLVADDQEDLIAGVQQITDGRGVDLALELSGSPDAVEMGLKLLRIGGRYVLIGSTAPSRPVALDPESVVRRLLRISGNHNYRPEDLATAVTFLTQHGERYPFDELVYDGFGLRDAHAAFDRAIEGDSLRVAVRPG